VLADGDGAAVVRLERRRRHGSLGGHRRGHSGHELGPLERDPAHAAPRIRVGLAHAPPQQRMRVDGQQGRLVRPVLEQGGGPGSGNARVVQPPRLVRSEPAEQRQVVGATQHVDRVDLDGAEAAERSHDVRASRRPARRAVQTLGRQRDTAGGPGAQAPRDTGTQTASLITPYWYPRRRYTTLGSLFDSSTNR
jgi:hypothetical protein